MSNILGHSEHAKTWISWSEKPVIDPIANYASTRERVGYVPRDKATRATYEALGFRCGLEIHQQLKTARKLFCRCPAGLYQIADDFDAQLLRHMRPTLSELGEYDGTALMEFKTRKHIIYRIKRETACTYDIDDTPPFPLNRAALAIAMQIALLLDTSIVGELHITRKQYLDGSIPTGFQRTAIVGIDGAVSVGSKHIGIRQLSLEEDSCREVSDRGHIRVYTTDRLGMPLVETVTEPEILTPDEAAETANHLRYVARSTGSVNTGIGAAREDVNVSIDGGTRVEIKGVQHIRAIPELTHNEAFRQRALLLVRDDLAIRVPDSATWSLRTLAIDRAEVPELMAAIQCGEDEQIVAVCLQKFAGLLSFFTSPGRCFADELSDRLKVVACIDKPNMLHSESLDPAMRMIDWEALRERFGADESDALVVAWGPSEDMPTAVETLRERCRWAFDGVPNETRKALSDGTTLFERVLPGPDRMYPDTDSAPIPIDEAMIGAARQALPALSVAEQVKQLKRWHVPLDAHAFVLRRNLFGLIRRLHEDVGLSSRSAGTLVGHDLRHASRSCPINQERIVNMAKAAASKGFPIDSLRVLLPAALAHLQLDLEGLLEQIGYHPCTREDVVVAIERLHGELEGNALSATDALNWMMGQVRPMAWGNMALRDVASIAKEILE